MIGLDRTDLEDHVQTFLVRGLPEHRVLVVEGRGFFPSQANKKLRSG